MEAIQDKNSTKTECEHSFHFQCLLRWSQRHNSCPMCRQEFIKTESEDEEEPPRERRYIDNSYNLVPIPPQVEDEERFMEVQARDFDIPDREWTHQLSNKMSSEFMRLHRMGNLRLRRKKAQILHDVLSVACSQTEAGYRSS